MLCNEMKAWIVRKLKILLLVFLTCIKKCHEVKMVRSNKINYV